MKSKIIIVIMSLLIITNIHARVDFNHFVNTISISNRILPNEVLEERFYLENIPKEYGRAFLYYTRNMKEIRPYFYSIMLHESNGFRAFVSTNRDGSKDLGPSQLNTNNIKNSRFRELYNPKDESRITNVYCFYMVMTINFYWDLVNKHGYDYAFYAYNGGERVVRMIKEGGSQNTSLIKAVSEYDKRVRSKLVETDIKLNTYIVNKRNEHVNALLEATTFNYINKSRVLLNRFKPSIITFYNELQKGNKLGNNDIFDIRRKKLLQFEIKEGFVVGKTVIRTFNIEC